MLCCFKSIGFLRPSAAPLPGLPQGRGPVGVFSGKAGTGGGGARAQVPAVADTGRETDEDGHRALCSGGLLPVPWRTGHQRMVPGIVNKRGGWGEVGVEAGERKEAKQRGIKGKEVN